MTAYRDQYASLFNEGRNVVLMGISGDPVDDLQSWLKDDDFPYLMASDPGSSVFEAFGGIPRENGMVGSRAVIVVDPEGRISHVIERFNQNDPTAYTELAEAIDAVAPEEDG